MGDARAATISGERAPAVLIPAVRQRLWGWPAAANFALGGLGAGLYVVAALAAAFEPAPALKLAAWLGPLLVATGFAAVATEAGRPLRGPRVLARVGRSWMSRELALGGVFAGLALAEFWLAIPALRALAAATAALLVLAQGLILREARGVTAWAVPVMPALFLVSSALSGMGGFLVFGALTGGAGPAAVGAALLLLALGALAWLGYLGWSPDPAFRDATRDLREGRLAVLLVGGGYLAPWTLLALAVALPGLAPPAAAAAGALMVGLQMVAKGGVILSAGHLRPIVVPNLRFGRRTS